MPRQVEALSGHAAEAALEAEHARQAEAARIAETALAAGKCPAGHKLESVPAGQTPSGYSSSGYCDLCGDGQMHTSGKENYHCAECRYDVCFDCRAKVHYMSVAGTAGIQFCIHLFLSWR